MKAFLLLGQSNMSGRGILSEVEPIKDERIKSFRMGSFFVATEPISFDRACAGVSLAMSFAKRYVDKYDEEIGLIPCALGGSPIEAWAKGEDLYEHAVAIGKLAQRNCEIIGILWHQGESNVNKNTKEDYKKRVLDVIYNIKKELNIEKAPVILGEIGDFIKDYSGADTSNYKIINEAINEIGECEGFGAVSSAGLEGNEDCLHFSARALREFGERYFEKYEEIK